jgi:hypothetical protein
MADTKPLPKPPRGWENSSHFPTSDYVQKKTKYGVYYMCRHCQRKPLTAGTREHSIHCHLRENKS